MTQSSSLEMQCCYIKPRTIKFVKGYEFLSFAKNVKNNY